MALILPIGERSGKFCYNAAAVFDRAGRHLGTYRKTHIPPSSSELKGGTGSYEKFYSRRGASSRSSSSRVSRSASRSATTASFPRARAPWPSRGGSALHADLCGDLRRDQAARQHLGAPAPGARLRDGVFVVAVNRSGDEGGRKHIGKSLIVNPVGAEIMALASAERPELLVATLALDDVDAAQTSLPGGATAARSSTRGRRRPEAGNLSVRDLPGTLTLSRKAGEEGGPAGERLASSA